MTNSLQKKPKASVILPLYNAENFLDVAIKSVLNQSYHDFELLLLNDGSTDGTLERIEGYVELDSRCIVHSWPNRGLVETLNEGIHLAQGDIIFRMDADDICYPGRFGKQMSYLQEHPECVAVGTKVMLIDSDCLPICPFAGKSEHDKIDLAHLAGKGGAIAHPSVAMRKSVIKSIGGYRAEFPHAEDIDLFLRLAEVGQLANLPEVLLYYRQHLDSIGYRHPQLQRDATRHAVIEAYQRRGLDIPVSLGDDVALQSVVFASVYHKWAWWALSDNNLTTARKYAFKALKARPFDVNNLRLLACVLRGY